MEAHKTNQNLNMEGGCDVMKQKMVVKYIAELEDRRERLMEFIQTSSDLNLSEKLIII